MPCCLLYWCCITSASTTQQTAVNCWQRWQCGPVLQETKATGQADIPGQISNLLASADVLDAVPWDGPVSGCDEANTYFQTPEGSQSYDWDLTMDTLDDVAEGEQTTTAHRVCSHKP